MTTYVTTIPRKFILKSGKIVTLTALDVEEKLTKDTLFRLWVPDTDAVYRYLVDVQDFEIATPATSKGEKYSLRKPLSDVWELHIRLYDDGFVDAEVEVRREFIEHLTPRRLNVVYEAFEFYRGIYDKLYILYAPMREWIINILDNFNVKLREPNTLTPWKPIVLGIVAAGLFTYALLRLAKGDGNELK
ncbi:MAG: hypothetical protein ACTSXX_14610 [Candidatus Baldrarchaeia archaeon]